MVHSMTPVVEAEKILKLEFFDLMYKRYNELQRLWHSSVPTCGSTALISGHYKSDIVICKIKWTEKTGIWIEI